MKPIKQIQPIKRFVLYAVRVNYTRHDKNSGGRFLFRFRKCNHDFLSNPPAQGQACGSMAHDQSSLSVIVDNKQRIS